MLRKNEKRSVEMKFNKLCIIFIMLLGLFFLTGCTAATGVETKAYVIAMGIDERRN